ncbi:MAG: tyrosine-type recombinase/integrase [Acidilobaceae archaeon]
MSRAIMQSYTIGEALEAFISNLMAQTRNPRTIKSYHVALRNFTNFIGFDRSISSLSIEDYLRWVSYLRSNNSLSDSTIHYYTIFVRRFLKWLGVDGDIPVPGSKKGFSGALSWSDVEKLLAASRDIIDLVSIALMAESGLRASELLSLRVSDIDLVNGVVRVIGKYGKQRLVVLGPISRTVIAEYITLAGKTPRDKLIEISYQALYKRIKKLAERAGLDTSIVRPHILRHTFATEALRRGMSLPILQKILGHSDLKVTQLYLHLTAEDVKREYEKIFGLQYYQTPNIQYQYRPWITIPGDIETAHFTTSRKNQRHFKK